MSIADYAATSALPDVWAVAVQTRMTLECRNGRWCCGNRSGRGAVRSEPGPGCADQIVYFPDLARSPQAAGPRYS
jgi:hypothetical protein